MVRKLTVAELDKALHNLERIEAYMAPRASWTVEEAAASPLAAMRQAVARLEVRLRPATSPADPNPPAGRQVTDVMEPGTVDAAQLASFAGFLDRLDQWFASSGATLPHDEAAESAERFLSCLGGLRHALDAMAARGADDVAAPPPAAPTRPATHGAAAGRGAGPSPVVDDVYDGAPRRDKGPAGPPRQIAFTAGDVDPMFRWVGAEDVQLTERAREQIEELFAEQGVSYFRYQLENFAEEVRRRIRTAPEGHVLVIKVREIGGERKPFLSYVAESTLPGGG